MIQHQVAATPFTYQMGGAADLGSVRCHLFKKYVGEGVVLQQLLCSVQAHTECKYMISRKREYLVLGSSERLCD